MQTYYVNYATGSDANVGSATKPFKTLAKISSGCTVYLHGSYYPNIVLSGLTDVTVLKDGVAKWPERALPTGDTGFHTCYVSLTSCTGVKIAGMSVSQSYFVADATFPKLTGKGVTLNLCAGCVIQNCEIFSFRDNTGWTAAQWNSWANGVAVLITGGTGGNNIFNNHLFNSQGIQLKGNNNLADSNLVENTITDFSGLWSGGNTLSNNVFRNSYRVNGNHNDESQIGPKVSHCNILNNTFVAFTDPNQPFKDLAMQCVGAYDGSSYITIKGNKIYGSHPIGIWCLGGVNNIIDQNEVFICCGQLWDPKRPPSISIQPSKSGGASKGNTVTNNKAPAYQIQTGSVTVQSNNYDTTQKKFVTFA